MNQDELNQKAKDIIKENIYLTLGTADGNPWVAPLFYCTDHEYNFYFISQMDSLHTKHVMKNPTVAFAIFDSHQKEGEGNGVQGNGSVRLLERDDLVDGLNYYSTTFIELEVNQLSENAPYRLFKLTPDKFYVLDPEAETDKRVEVFVVTTKTS